MPANSLFSGFNYLLRGANLLTAPSLRPFILVPLLINLTLFIIATTILIQQFDLALEWLLEALPGWLDFLAWILWFLFALVILLVYGYSFSAITNLIAAPFYGLLAEKVEAMVSGRAPPMESFTQMIPRTLARELKKLWYFIVRGLGVALLMLVFSFIPLLNVLVPIIGLLWGAWSMSIQYADYTADNHQLPFTRLRKRLGRPVFSTYGFGGLVMLGTMIPVINILVMPAAVAGGTLFWLNELQRD